jgi:PAS domain-containing protein
MSVQLKHELEKILEFSNDIICLIDEKGVFIRVSRAVMAVLSYLPTDVVGKSYKDFIHPDDFETSITCVRELIEGSGIARLKIVIGIVRGILCQYHGPQVGMRMPVLCIVLAGMLPQQGKWKHCFYVMTMLPVLLPMP